ncbi:MAG: DUF1007 family protein [Spirochaetia bacterium]
MKRYILISLLWMILGIPLWAHPHMFIDSQVTAVFNQDELQGFWVEWRFDQMFTASIRMDYDRNRDGDFNDREVQMIEENAFRNLENYNYFTSIYRDGQEYQVDRVEQFDAWMEDERLFYRFFIPHTLSLSEQEQRVKVVIFDETFFSDIAYKEQDPVSIEGREFVSAKARIQKNRDAAISYDPTGGMSRDDDDGTAAGRAFPYELYLTFEGK